jgi:putative protein-disulfide isomerase
MTAQLVYFADPMCSWCWGFKPSLMAVLAKYGQDLPLRMIMGGLRPGTTKVMDDAQKATIRDHWKHVKEASGQPFDFDFFKREGFVYDTEPACRAVVAGGHVAPEYVLDLLILIQQAFYQEGRDVTDTGVLVELAEAAGMERNAFLEAFDSEAVKQETLQGFALTQKIGIQGFPTLLIGDDEHGYDLITAGFQQPKAIVERLEQWLLDHQSHASARQH